MKKHIDKIALALIVVSLLASFFLNYHRLEAENNYRSVEVLIDFNELNALATANDVPLDTLSARFKEAGATGVLMKERTLDELKTDGYIVILKGSELILYQQAAGDLFPGIQPVNQDTYILTYDKSVYETVKTGLEMINKRLGVWQSKEVYLIGVSLTQKELEKLGMGFLPKDLSAVHRGGLSIVPRIRDGSRASEQEIALLAQSLRAMPGLSMISFHDPVIPGSGNIPLLAQELKKLDVPVGMFEFFPQAGLNTLARLLEKNVVRIHAISENDMTRYNEALAIERFNLAAAERNIRTLYVRFFGMDHPAHVLDRALQYVSDIKANLEKEGLVTGQAAPLLGIPYSRLIVFAVGLGVIAGGVLILNALLAVRWTLLLSALGVFGWAAGLLLEPLLARKGFALLAVIIFPVIGITALLREESRSLKEAIAALLQMSAVSLAGAVIMTGLLADKSFMLTLDIFSGVKLAHLAPLVLIPLYFIVKGAKPVERVKEILDYPVLNKHVAAGIVIAAALVVYIIRTGNEAPQLVTSWETTLRSLLDRWLGVRPRTKEFLLGHPAMLVLLYYGYDLRKIGLLLFGIIGQVSLVNTYAHIHTPLLVSLTRSFHGLWIGILAGVIIILAVNSSTRLLGRRLAGE